MRRAGTVLPDREGPEGAAGDAAEMLSRAIVRKAAAMREFRGVRKAAFRLFQGASAKVASGRLPGGRRPEGRASFWRPRKKEKRMFGNARNALKTALAAIVLTGAAAGCLSPAAEAARTPTGLEGHWSGRLPVGGEVSDAELTLDDFGCWAAAVRKIPGVDVGLYALKDGRMELRTPEGLVVRTFVVGEDGRLHLEHEGEAEKDWTSGQDGRNGCCVFYRD